MLSPVKVLGEREKIDVEIASGCCRAILRYHQVSGLELGKRQICILEYVFYKKLFVTNPYGV